jgi:UDP-N-acetylglucosamine--N-acetylmuramyl-(pentapeptide) pyrophosphoryl-undecaprenol N-acetylglucosamine transferase
LMLNPKLPRNVPRYIISGGGTGGHIFPAIAIADALKAAMPDAEILFVGANGRMEMERVPKAGYDIVGLDIMGIQRKLTLSNFKVPFMLIRSLVKARKVIKKFKPDAAIGVGGYASGPLLKVASIMGIPTLIQEQNSYPGITNKLLSKRAAAICVAYEGMERFFPKDKIKLTGNPVRKTVVDISNKRAEGLDYFGVSPEKKTLLIIGGSLGAGSINAALTDHHEALTEDLGLNVIWQTGQRYYEGIMSKIGSHADGANLHVTKFIDRMDLAYAAADIVMSRAGALSISELCLIGKPAVLVPSPNVSEDHQTKNAMALVNRNAAVLLKDVEVSQHLVSTLSGLVSDAAKCEMLSVEISKLGKADATNDIVEAIEFIDKH